MNLFDVTANHHSASSGDLLPTHHQKSCLPRENRKALVRDGEVS